MTDEANWLQQQLFAMAGGNTSRKFYIRYYVWSRWTGTLSKPATANSQSLAVMPQNKLSYWTMNIYTEFKAEKLRIKTGDEELEIKIRTDFYTPIPGTESFQMFRDKETNNRIKDFIDRHKSKLGLLEKILYWFFRNRVLVLVDKEVQNLATIGQLYSYGTIYLDGRTVSIIKKPDTFDSNKLENTESIQTTSINRRGKIIGDVVISKLT